MIIVFLHAGDKGRINGMSDTGHPLLINCGFYGILRFNNEFLLQMITCGVMMGMHIFSRKTRLSKNEIDMENRI